MNKNSFLYTNMVKYRLKFTAIVILIAILFCTFTVDSYKYISKRLFGAVPLDTQAFSAVEKTLLKSDFVCDTSSDDAQIYGYALKGTSYFQGDKYYFDVVAEDVMHKNIAYTRDGVPATEDTDTDADPIAVRADYIIVNGVTVPVLMNSDQHISKGDVITGIFTRSSTRILEEFAKKSDGKDMEICKYTLDIRGIEMEAEFSDCIIFIILTLILIYLLTKLISYYINPLRHPMLKQLERYGEVPHVMEDIESELRDKENVTWGKKEIYTKSWILQKKSFKYAVVKNHTASGNFKYTPDFH